MKPKEKAEELVLKFLRIENNTPEWFNTHIAKQCALIVVDEVLECYPAKCPKESYEMEQHIYWQQIKTEINNL